MSAQTPPQESPVDTSDETSKTAVLHSARGEDILTNESRAPAHTLVLEAHKVSVRCLAALDHGRLASAGGDNGIIIIWNLADGEQLDKRERELKGHTNEIYALAALAGGARLASSGWDETVIRRV